jgi:hypothetical protein
MLRHSKDVYEAHFTVCFLFWLNKSENIQNNADLSRIQMTLK